MPGSPGTQKSTHNRVASLGTVPEVDRPGSRNSINFSYPMGSRPISPTSPVENRPMNLDVVSVRESPDEGAAVRPPISERSGNTKTRTSASGSAENTRAAKPAGVAVDTALAAATLSLQKSSPRPDIDHTKAERASHGVSAPSSQEQRIDRSVPPVDTGSASEQLSSRAGLERWPSTVLEENEPNELGEARIPTTQHTRAQLASAFPVVDQREAVSTPQASPQPSPKASKDTTPQQETHIRQSSSPGRSARFAKWLSVSAAGDQVHEPPPRSVSPVKSALKNPRGTSLSPDRKVSLGGRIVQPPSEISDGTSVASDEGSRVGMKRRPVKVSFDDEAEVVGVAASPPTSPEEYVPESLPSKGKSRMSWLGVGKKRVSSLDFVTGDDDFDEVMKPRPALPSFGSIRGNRDGGNTRPAIPEFSDNESTSSSDNDIVAPGLSFSNDHALGGLLPQVLRKEPAQPHAVTTLEQLSVTGPSSPYQPTPAPEELDIVALGNSTDKLSPGPKADVDLPVPAIAIEPATPPVDSDRPSFKQRSSLDCRVPGGFPASSSDRSLKEAAPAASADAMIPQGIDSAAPKLDDGDTEGESGDSVYSDAAEDIDGDGFGSINAIVDEPVPCSPGLSSHSRDATPKATGRIAAAIDSQSQDVTDQPREDPRSVTPTQESVNREMSESPITPSSNREFKAPYPVLLIDTKAPSLPNNTAIHSTSNKQSRPASLATHEDFHLQYPNSVPTNASKPKTRPVSLGAAFQMKQTNGVSAGFSNPLRRTMSNGSDSSSSFKRASSVRSDAPFSMRRTMRGSSTQLSVSSYSGRADSPDDRRPFSSGSGAGTMRKTLRSPNGGNERYSFFSTNNKAPRAKFTKAAPKSMRSSRFVDSDGEGEDAPAQAFRSRFADSSDEEEPVSNAMRPVRGIPRQQGIHDGDSTDLDDSSEEERQVQAAAVAARRPDPAPPGSRDKTSPNMSGFAAVAKQRGMTQRELEEFLMQPPRGRKPGLLARLGLKKAKNPEHRIRKADVESPSRRDTPLERSRLEREQLRGEPFTNVVNGNRVVTTVSADPPEPASPRKAGRRLLKRHITGADHWPLRPEPRNETPEPIEQSQSLPSSPLQDHKVWPPAANAERNGSVTVNGSEGTGPIPTIKEEPEPPQPGQAALDVSDARSDITGTTAEEPGLSARDVVITGSGRKKRFPLLRKAFGFRK